LKDRMDRIPLFSLFGWMWTQEENCIGMAYNYLMFGGKWPPSPRIRTKKTIWRVFSKTLMYKSFFYSRKSIFDFGRLCFKLSNLLFTKVDFSHTHVKYNNNIMAIIIHVLQFMGRWYTAHNANGCTRQFGDASLYR